MGEIIIAFILALCTAIVFGGALAIIIIQYCKHGGITLTIDINDDPEL